MRRIWSLSCLLVLVFVSAEGQVGPTPGFFLDDWVAKKFTAPDVRPGDVPASASVTVTVEADSVITRIPSSIYAHNAVTWMGPMVTQPVLMANLNNLQPHVLRWPAGSGSDGYFWDRGPGDLPKDIPDTLLNENGKRVRPRWFYGKPGPRRGASLDDYYALLRQTGSEGLITVNYGYARYGTSADPVAAAAHYAADWVRYDHGRTRYWEIGNENFGFWELGYQIDPALNRDGQPRLLTGELYGRHFKVFADSMRRAAAEVGATIHIGAVLVDVPPERWAPGITQNWNAGLLGAAPDKADFFVVHDYFTPYNKNSGAAEILYDAATVPGRIVTYVRQSVKEAGAVMKPVALDEWNMFAVGSRQQVSNVSGLFGVIVLGEALRNKFGLAARWDLMNGWAGGNDHGLFSAGDEPGVRRWEPRPSFYYLYYFERMTGDRLIGCRVSGDTAIRAYASRFTGGEVGAALVNTGGSPVTVTVAAAGLKRQKRYYWYSLQGGDDNGEFSGRVIVNGQASAAGAGGPADYATMKAFSAGSAQGVRVMVPARGAVFLVIGK